MKRKHPVKVQIWVTEWRSQPVVRPSWKTQALTATALLGATSLIVSGSWLAIQLILNPTDLSWWGHWLPTSTFAMGKPQTLDEINAEVKQAGHLPSPALHFSTYPGITPKNLGFHDVLLPIARPLKSCDNATANCNQIIELRVYRAVTHQVSPAKGMTYELLDRMAVQGPEEMVAIAPLTSVAAIPQGSTRTLPLTKLQWIDGKVPVGIWFQLSGLWKRGSVVLYGQVFHYNPNRGRLNLLQTWSSVAGRLPHWRQVTGTAASELVVDQSLGLEPQFQVFQVKASRSSVQPMRLEPINLTETVLDDRPYQNALLLARHGLWSSALALLQSIKSRVQPQGHWSATAQAQLDLIALHANATQTQADRDWASPTQQVLAQVMDGRWSKGLNLLKAAHRSGYDVKSLLTSNADRLWQRVEAALRVNPRQTELQQWGTLVLAVKQNRSQALAWFRKQPGATQTKDTIASIEQTLALLDAPQLPDGPPQSGSAARQTPTRPFTGLIGAVQPIAKLQEKDWLAPQPEALTLAAQQHWYRIEILSLENQAAWQQAIAEYQNQVSRNSQQTQTLWQQLGLAEVSLQLVSWEGAKPSHSVVVTVKAVRLNRDNLSLLVQGEALPRPSGAFLGIAITPNSVAWAPIVATSTLQALDQQQPSWQKTLWPQLWQNLQTAQLISEDLQEVDLVNAIGDWLVQQMELTGDQSPEAVLTIEAQENDPTPHTLIFSEQGQILYNDLQTDRSLITIAQQTDRSLPVLITMTDQGLELQQWSEQHQRFDRKSR